MTEVLDESRRSGRSRPDQRPDHRDPSEAEVSDQRLRVSRAISDPLQDQSQDQDQRRRPALVRSKTFDPSLLRVAPDVDTKIERKKSHYSQLSKTNGHYHKIFKEISNDEQLQQSYTCALQKDILYQGRMFVSEHWICFHSKVFGKDTKIAIPVVSVTHVKKTKTALLLPNALVIATANDRYVFVSFLSRDNTYKFLLSSCLHLEEKSPWSSPISSSVDSSFRGHRGQKGQTPRFPLAFSGDLVDPRRQELEESSSSDSQTPDYDKINEFPVPEFLLTRPENSPTPKVCEKNQINQTQQQQSSENQLRGSELVLDSRRTVPLSALLCVYMLLVCVLLLSSCYLAVKIVSLEQKLSTLEPTDFTEQQDVLRATSERNSDLFSELITINLLKLEKVQRNLQRLLDEAS
ncbi:GRAM domain-containing protein 2B [Eucyclogobius newberryi]|uniref:GRAM domain-containing protein 2B n=1 Tax=Eucyclogobius newberryi TaxID=166745 RepID=UPI003B5A5F23